MGSKIIEYHNALLLLDVMQDVIDKYTIEKDSKIKTLSVTGVSMDQLSRLLQYTTRNHFQINGDAIFKQDWREQSLNLISARHTSLDLLYKFKWGDIQIGWTKPDTPQNQYIATRYSDREGFSIYCFINQNSDNQMGGYDFNREISKLLPIVGIEQEQGDRQELSGRALANIDLTGTFRSFSLLFKEEKYVERINKLLDHFLEGLPQPDNHHLILTSDFQTIKYLHESGQVEPCKKCCPYHLAYDHPQPRGDNFNTGRLLELAKFLISEPAKHRMIRFTGFRWTWENEAEPDFVNSLVWYMSKRKPPSVYMWHDQDNPLPRGLFQKIKEDASSLLERRMKSIS